MERHTLPHGFSFTVLGGIIENMRNTVLGYRGDAFNNPPEYTQSRNFHARCSAQIKDTFFLFTKIEKIDLKPSKRKIPFHILVFPHFRKQTQKSSTLSK